jgi:Holliday junction resolvase RusA-like endonuclease
MEKKLDFSVLGKPLPKKRWRIQEFDKNGNRLPRVKKYYPGAEDEKAFAKTALHSIRSQGILTPLDGPLALHVTYYMPMIKSMPKWKQRDVLRGLHVWHTVTPDASNLLKFTEDALNKIAWMDDGRISRIVLDKVYGATTRQDLQVYALEGAKRMSR